MAGARLPPAPRSAGRPQRSAATTSIDRHTTLRQSMPRAMHRIHKNMDNTATAHQAAETLSLLLVGAGIEPLIIAEALVTTGLAFLAVKNTEMAAVFTEAFLEAIDGR